MGHFLMTEKEGHLPESRGYHDQKKKGNPWMLRRQKQYLLQLNKIVPKLIPSPAGHYVPVHYFGHPIHQSLSKGC